MVRQEIHDDLIVHRFLYEIFPILMVRQQKNPVVLALDHRFVRVHEPVMNLTM